MQSSCDLVDVDYIGRSWHVLHYVVENTIHSAVKRAWCQQPAWIRGVNINLFCRSVPTLSVLNNWPLKTAHTHVRTWQCWCENLCQKLPLVLTSPAAAVFTTGRLLSFRFCDTTLIFIRLEFYVRLSPEKGLPEISMWWLLEQNATDWMPRLSTNQQLQCSDFHRRNKRLGNLVKQMTKSLTQ